MKTAADAGVRTLPWVEPPAQSERRFYSAPSNLFSRGWSDRVPAVPDRFSPGGSGSFWFARDSGSLRSPV